MIGKACGEVIGEKPICRGTVIGIDTLEEDVPVGRGVVGERGR